MEIFSSLGRAAKHAAQTTSGPLQPIRLRSRTPLPTDCIRLMGLPMWPRRLLQSGTLPSASKRCTWGAPLCFIITQRRLDPMSAMGKGTSCCWSSAIEGWGNGITELSAGSLHGGISHAPSKGCYIKLLLGLGKTTKEVRWCFLLDRVVGHHLVSLWRYSSFVQGAQQVSADIPTSHDRAFCVCAIWRTSSMCVSLTTADHSSRESAYLMRILHTLAKVRSPSASASSGCVPFI